MTDEEFLRKFGQTIRTIRENKNLSQEMFAEICGLHRTYISGIENGDRNISISNLNQIITNLGLSWHEFAAKLSNNKAAEVHEPVMEYNEIDHTRFFDNVTTAGYNKIEVFMTSLINNSSIKSRDVISKAFIEAVKQWPGENISDIWHHCIYRIYLKNKKGTDPEQSWVRTSGEAFELFLENQYNKFLSEKKIRIKNLISHDEKIRVLNKIGLANSIGSSKIDLIIEQKGNGLGLGLDHAGWGVIAAIHAKVSLAERVSDDIPASRILMETGIDSILMTLDVKSFPPPHGDLINRGELGTIEKPSDKRKYIEEHGDFSICFSYNKRTVPSSIHTTSGKKIETLFSFNENDNFMTYLMKRFCN
jgi:transcriptional regulator with XRE-family HTH domain